MDHHAEGVVGHGPAHQVGQCRLPVGIGFINILYAQPLEHPTDRNRVGDVVEVSPRGGVVLVSGHGRGAVFHENQGKIVPVEQGIDDAGQAGVEKSGISQESDHRPPVVEKRQSGSDARGRAHAHEHLADLVRRQVSQGVAADIGHGDVVF